jgi:hypothetical protein
MDDKDKSLSSNVPKMGNEVKHPFELKVDCREVTIVVVWRIRARAW